MAVESRIRCRASALLGAAAVMVVTAAAPAAAVTLYGLPSTGTFLIRFDSATPGVITAAAAITGLQPGERIVGIDFRPRTGQLYGVGVIGPVVDTARVYTIDPASGAATLIPGSTPIGSLTGSQYYGASFNPTVDRLRVVNASDENFRVNPNNGARADTPTNDTNVNPGGNLIAAIAYDRPFDAGLAVANRTTLFAISPVTDSLLTMGGIDQSPSPNGGQLFSIGSLFTNVGGDAGFDIDVDGTAFAALTPVAVVGVSSLYTIDLLTGMATLIGSIGDGNFAIGGLAAAPRSVVAVGSDLGNEPRVRVLDALDGTERFSFLAYDAKMKKGVRVALGDVDLDSVPELVTAPGKGSPPEIHIYSGTTGAPLPGSLGSFLAFDATFKGGVFVAAGDVNGDGHKDVIAGAGPGGAEVKVFSGADAENLLTFTPYEAPFKGGVQVAAADFDLDGDYEIVTGPGKGGAPEVRVFDGAGQPFTSAALPNLPNKIVAYDAKLKTGIFVAAGDVDGDGHPDIITGTGKGALPEVAVFSGVDGSELRRFLAFDRKSKTGVRVAAADVDGDGRAEILASPGTGRTATEVRAFDGRTGVEKVGRLALDPKYHKGAFVAGVRR